MSDSRGVEVKFCCPFCGRFFARCVRTSGGGRHACVSDQVRCDCGNFLPSAGRY